MQVKNNSNYPKTVNGVRIEPDETEEVNIDQDRLQHFRDDGYLELEEDNSETSSEEEGSEDDNEETSKPEEKNNEKGDD